MRKLTNKVNTVTNNILYGDIIKLKNNFFDSDNIMAFTLHRPLPKSFYTVQIIAFE